MNSFFSFLDSTILIRFSDTIMKRKYFEKSMNVIIVNSWAIGKILSLSWVQNRINLYKNVWPNAWAYCSESKNWHTDRERCHSMCLSTWNNDNRTSGHQNLGVAQMHSTNICAVLLSFSILRTFLPRFLLLFLIFSSLRSFVELVCTISFVWKNVSFKCVSAYFCVCVQQP